mgnify:CR=1 FL=1
MTQRVQATDAAKEIIDQLREQHGELMFHQSGGCCDGSSPMCFPKGDLMINETDVYLGTIHGCEFFMSKDQFDFGFAVDWMRKDLKIAMEESKRNNSPLPITKIIDEYYAEVQKMGGNRWDTSSLIKRLRK